MKTYLSIDLDFWNYWAAFDSFIPDPWSKIATLITTGIPILAVENHDELIEHVNKYKPDTIVNVDYHDDLGDGTEETGSPSCANWPLHVENTGRIKYIWRHPHTEDIVPGLCNEERRFPDLSLVYCNEARENNGVVSKSTLRKIKKIWRDEGDCGFRSKTLAFGFPEMGRIGRIVAVGISISPAYTVAIANPIIDAACLLLESRANIEVRETARTAISELITNKKSREKRNF